MMIKYHNQMRKTVITQIVVLGVKKGMSLNFLEDVIQDYVDLWDNQQKELARLVIQFQDSVNDAERILLSENTPLKAWGRYGWTLSPHAQINDYYMIPKSKYEADKYMCSIHNDYATKASIDSIKRRNRHSIQDI